MQCKHQEGAALVKPRPNQAVHREDCTQCFDSVDNDWGLAVCLHCFNGGCLGPRNHAMHHFRNTSHPLVLCIQRRRKPVTHRESPSRKIKKLEIVPEDKESQFETRLSLRCLDCGLEDLDQNHHGMPEIIEAVLKANTFVAHEEVKAWAQEIVPCEHVFCLIQDLPQRTIKEYLTRCSRCSLQHNLWLCLQCGNVGCGRPQHGGGGGNGHGMNHATELLHPIAVKLGSITADSPADVYCYTCDEDRQDPQISTHLQHWGIDISAWNKTEKSMAEMQIEQNLKWDFSTKGDGDSESVVLYGPGLTGLKNLGNSCYMASILQCLFSLPEFQERYHISQAFQESTITPASSLETQLQRLADGLLSGRYSVPGANRVINDIQLQEQEGQNGLSPAMLKHVIGREHAEFSSMRQQDAFEFFLHLIKLISRSCIVAKRPDPTQSFRFTMEQRLQCRECKRVRYRYDEQDNISIAIPARPLLQDSPGDIQGADKNSSFESVTLKECLDIFTSSEAVDLRCPGCRASQFFDKRTLFKTFPQNLVIHAQRFGIVNQSPTKLSIALDIDHDFLDLSPYKARESAQDEEALPDDPQSDPGTNFVPDTVAEAYLIDMGFPRSHVRKALQSTGNNDSQAAMEWLLSHMEDSDLDAPSDADNLGYPRTETFDSQGISSLCAMGITEQQARQALAETDGDLNRALDWVFSHNQQVDIVNHKEVEDSNPQGTSEIVSSNKPPIFLLESFVCHKGPSVHAGHYIAVVGNLKNETVRAPDDWILFNDEKVVKAPNPTDLSKSAYVYLFRRRS